MNILKFQSFYELCGFIEYVGHLPSKESAHTRGHYIGYRYINFTWIRNDDHRCHRTNIEGAYKVNMAFYKSMSSNVASTFILDDEGILFWKKSVIIRGVYQPCGRRGRGRGKKNTQNSMQQSETLDEDDMYIFGESSSSENEDEETSKMH